MSPTRRVLTVACLLIAGVGLTACSGDDPATAKGAEDAVRDYLDEFSDGDYDDACDFWTEENTERSIDEWNETFGADEPVEDCEEMLEQGAVLAEAFGESLGLEIDSISSESTGDDTARVTVDYKHQDDSGDFLMVYEDGQWLVDDEFDDEGADATEEPIEEETTAEAPAEPSSIGEQVTVGDWTITVTDVEENADQTIEKANEFNDPARGQYVLVTYAATYTGGERSADIQWDLTWSFTGTDAKVLDEADAVTPFENEGRPTEARTGGTIDGQAVFDVDPGVYEGGLLSVETYSADGEEEYVDFQL
jgi:hypothetical protein